MLLSVGVVAVVVSVWLAVRGAGGHPVGQRARALPVSSTLPFPEAAVTSPAASTTTVPTFYGSGQGVLVYADPTALHVVHFVAVGEGRSTARVATFDVGPPGPDQPFVTGDTVVFIAAQQAFTLVPPYGPGDMRGLGAADHVLPAVDPGKVWVVTGEGTNSIFIRLTDLSGSDHTPPAPVPLPAHTRALGSVASGILLQDAGGVLEVWSPGARNVIRRLGWTAYVLDTRGSMVAWTEGGALACYAGECKLHVTDVAAGTDRVITPPAGSDGYLGGGAISPDGHTLAAFVRGSATDHPTAALVLVDIPTGRVKGPVDQSAVPIGEPIVAAVWSRSSGWLYFSGLGDSMKEYLPGDARAEPVPEPASYSFTAT